MREAAKRERWGLGAGRGGNVENIEGGDRVGEEGKERRGNRETVKRELGRGCGGEAKNMEAVLGVV